VIVAWVAQQVRVQQQVMHLLLLAKHPLLLVMHLLLLVMHHPPSVGASSR
jgi:hypothetical protein